VDWCCSRPRWPTTCCSNIIATQGEDSVLRRAVGGDWKGKLSPLLYLTGIGLNFVSAWLGQALYVLVA
jgi:hypothetical protein